VEVVSRAFATDQIANARVPIVAKTWCSSVARAAAGEVTANTRGSLLLPHRWAVQSQKRGEVEDTVQEQCPMQLTGHTLHVELGADKLIRALPVIEGVPLGSKR
jgi:hypothetical protein